MRSPRLLFVAAVSALALSACGEEQQAAQAPAPQEQPQAPAQPEPPRDNVQDAARSLREAGEALSRAAKDGAQTLTERGREAMENAGPALERAGEVARQLGDSVDRIIAQAREDFDAGVAQLQRQIDSASARDGNGQIALPGAALPTRESLSADTRAAAQARSAGVGPAYVGVWAPDAASCARVDVEPLENFAVITPTTIRRFETICNFDAAEMSNGNATVAAACFGEGETEERQITFSMADENRLAISMPGAQGAAQLIRCSLPQ